MKISYKKTLLEYLLEVNTRQEIHTVTLSSEDFYIVLDSADYDHNYLDDFPDSGRYLWEWFTLEQGITIRLDKTLPNIGENFI